MSRIGFLILGLSFILFTESYAMGQAKSEGKFYALVVGVSNYTSPLKPLNGLVKAAKEMEVALEKFAIKRGYPKEKTIIKLLVDTNTNSDFHPTRENILVALQTIASQTPRTKDTVVFYFIGHGQNGQLLASGANGKFPARHIPFDEIEKRLQKSSAGTKILFIDSCRSSSSTLSETKTFLNKELKEKSFSQGTVIFYSSDENQESQIDKILNYGIFTKHLLEGLKGDAEGWGELGKNDRKLFAGELLDYLAEKIQDTVGEQFPGTFQTPVMKAYSKKGSFRLYDISLSTPKTSEKTTTPKSFTNAKPGIYLTVNADKGTPFQKRMIQTIQVNGNYDGTFPAIFENHVRGACAQKDIEKGTHLTWENLSLNCNMK